MLVCDTHSMDGNPAAAPPPVDPAALVLDGAVDRRIYSDPAVFKLEMERLFVRSWTLVGHESQMKSSGDYLLAQIAQRSIIVIRDGEGTINAFLNACTHRGAPLCVNARGRAPRLVCPYHSWTFKTDGKLIGIPLRGEYGDDFDWSAHNLRRAGQVSVYRGFIFVSPQPTETLEEFLGDMRFAFDDLVDRAPDLEIEALPSVQRHRYRANWKLIFENLNDSLHLLSAHASAGTALEMVEDKERLDPIMRLSASAPKPEKLQALVSRFYANGHSFAAGTHSLGGARTQPDDPLFQAIAAKRGEEEAYRVLDNERHISLVYPSATVNARMSTVRLVRPLGVNDTEVIAIVFRLKGAPESVLQGTLNYSIVSGSPTSFVLADDIEIFERSQNVFDGARDDRNSMHRGAGHEEAIEHGTRANGTSEAYIRNQYAAWSNLMAEA